MSTTNLPEFPPSLLDSIRALARRRARGNYHLEQDFFSAGLYGAAKAIHHYDASKNPSFPAYAYRFASFEMLAWWTERSGLTRGQRDKMKRDGTPAPVSMTSLDLLMEEGFDIVGDEAIGPDEHAARLLEWSVEIMKLPPLEAFVIFQRIVNEKSCTELATFLDVTRQQIFLTQQRAIEKLRLSCAHLQ